MIDLIAAASIDLRGRSKNQGGRSWDSDMYVMNVFTTPEFEFA